MQSKGQFTQGFRNKEEGVAMDTGHTNRRKILDCTLRDGGYVNNWEFDFSAACGLRDALYDSGVRYIELGIMGQGGIAGKQTKFSSFDAIRPLLTERKPDCRYCVMTTLTELGVPEMEPPERNKETVDVIRLAYFKPEMELALEAARSLKDKGYEVFLQAMATFMYDESELKAMLEKVNRIQPAAFYIVDSFSTMYPNDVREIAGKVQTELDSGILFGFHAHNNIQMAYANAISFIDLPTDRTLMVDGSVYGMGRGAGNVPTELLMEYMNSRHDGTYRVPFVLDAYYHILAPIFKQYYWGYSIPYYLTAIKGINSAYSWYLGNKGIHAPADLNEILDAIPEDVRYTLKRDIIDSILAAR